jgi:hypothetical protein
MSDILKSHDAAIANAYVLKTGMKAKDLLNLMDKETYFDAKTALEHGFVDEIMFDNELKLSANVGVSAIPEEIINKMRTFLSQEQPKEPENGAVIPQPTSDIAIQEQQEEFKRLKNKIREVMSKC